MYVQNVLDQFKLKLIQMRFIQIRYIQFRVKIWRFCVNRTRGDDCTFLFSDRNYHSYWWPQTTGPFFSGHNYVKIGFGGNVTTGKTKNVQSSGRLCFSAGSNYNRKNTTGKKSTVVRPSVGNWKKLRPKKKVEATWQILPPDRFLQAVLEDLTRGHLVNV